MKQSRTANGKFAKKQETSTFTIPADTLKESVQYRFILSFGHKCPENRLAPALGAVSFCGIACFLLGYLVAVTF